MTTNETCELVALFVLISFKALGGCIWCLAKNWLTTCPTLLGLLRSVCLWHPEEPEVRYVDQEYISKLKSECETKVSTNDILTSHLLQKSRFGYGYMSINLRNRGLGANDSNAGNYVHRIHLAPERFLHPEGVRKSLAGPETLAPPNCWDSMTLRHGLVSNWSHFFQEASWRVNTKSLLGRFGPVVVS